MPFRQHLRTPAVEALSLVSRLQGFKALRTPRVHFLYFHSLRAQDEATFSALLQALVATHDFVSYSEAVTSLRDGAAAERPSFCVSTDDAFKSSGRVAELAERFGGTICIFAPTGLIGLSTRSEIASFFGTNTGIENSALSWDELRALRARGHEVGSHTISHPNLAKCSPQRVEEELFGSRSALIKELGEATHCAWPYGRFEHASATVAAVAERAGYGSLASAERGSHVRGRSSGPVPIIHRDHIDPAWPSRHSLMFLNRSARNPRSASGWTRRH